MSYYGDKRRAFDIIDSMLAAGKSAEEIEFKISKLFGFGRKIVTERIKLVKAVAAQQ